MLKHRHLIGIASTIALFAGSAVANAKDAPNIDLRIGVLAGLSGDLAQSGQPWTEATRIAVENIDEQIKSWGLSDKFKVSFVGAEDSQGNAQSGVEAARKLVDVDGANVVVGDFYSSVTIAAAQAVFIPEEIIDFTGGTAPSIADLNKSTGKTWMWRVAPPDSIQGPVVAKLIGDTVGAGKTINVAARNDTYGVGLLDAFKKAWIASGGKIGTETIYNADSPTLDTEAQAIASGNPDGWFIVSFCGDWGKLKGPLQRTGKWDPKRTFGGDALGGCPVPNETLAGMRNTRGDVQSGVSNASFAKLYKERAKPGVPFAGFTAQSFDAPYVAFLAALAAGSSDTNGIRENLPAVTSAPGVTCDFTTLKTCVDALLDGKDVDFEGASGALAFDSGGEPAIVTYAILESAGDGALDDKIIGRVTLGQ